MIVFKERRNAPAARSESGTRLCSWQRVTNSSRLPVKPLLCLKARSNKSVTKAPTICSGKACSLRQGQFAGRSDLQSLESVPGVLGFWSTGKPL